MSRHRRFVEVLRSNLAFPESPRWHGDKLVFSDIYAGVVRELARDGGVATVCEVAGLPSGIGWAPDGRMLVASMMDRRLLRMGPDGLDPVVDLSAVTRGAITDMVVDDRGRAYIGNLGFHFSQEPIRPSNLVLVGTDGTVEVQGDGLLMPNGCVLTPDGRTLIVAETFGGRLTAFDVAPDGRCLVSAHGHRSGRASSPTSTRPTPPVSACQMGSRWTTRVRSGSPMPEEARFCG